MRKYIVAAIAAFALVGATQFHNEAQAASAFCPPTVIQPSYTVFVGGTVGTAEAVGTLNQAAPRTAVKINFYVFDVADNGHREGVLFGSPRDLQIRSLWPGVAPVGCDIKYSTYRIDLTGAGHWETVIVGSIREAQLRATGYIQ